MKSPEPLENSASSNSPEPAPAGGKAPGFSVHGIEFALGIVVLGALGWWADGALGWRNTFPVLLVAGVLTGFAWGIWRLNRALGRRKPPRHPPQPPD